MKTYLDQPYVTVSLDETVPSVFVNHHSYQTSEEFRLTINSGIQCFNENKANNPKLGWLGDTRKQGALSDEDLKWCGETMAAQCVGLKKVALVIPEDIFGQLSISEFVDTQSGSGMTNKMFSSLEEAKKWIAN